METLQDVDSFRWQNEEKQRQHSGMKWLNKFIWFTDMYIFYQPHDGSITVQF